MRMAWDQLKHLPVVTKSGQRLGKVSGLVFDPEGHSIVQYEVKASLPFGRTLLVAATQVLSITNQQMTVDDLTGSQPAVAENAASVPDTAGTLAALRDS